VPAVLVTYLLGSNLSILELFINLVGGILFIAVGAITIQNYQHQCKLSVMFSSEKLITEIFWELAKKSSSVNSNGTGRKILYCRWPKSGYQELKDLS
jgi:hypothetical protein